MKNILAGIVALCVSVASSNTANAKQIVMPIISDNNVNRLVNKDEKIPKASLSSSLNNKQLIAQSFARLNFSWRTSHSLELTSVAINFIFTAKTSDFITLALLLASGHDVYIVRVRLDNTGNVPLRVYPQYIRAYYRNTYTTVIPIADNRFLQQSILYPGYYIDQPAIFIAPYGLDIVRNIRMGYADGSIQVINN
jgi:hypothetical protein